LSLLYELHGFYQTDLSELRVMKLLTQNNICFDRDVEVKDVGFL
jgi:hypothetical protein